MSLRLTYPHAIALLISMLTGASPGADAGGTDSSGASKDLLTLDTITVIARPMTSQISSVRVLTSDDFAGTVTDLPALLERESGITVRRSGGVGDYAEASVRGSSAKNLQVYLDGIPMTFASGSAVDLSKIPLGMMQDVTIYKGTVPLQFAGRSPYGVISLNSIARQDIFSANAELGNFELPHVSSGRGGVLARKTLGRTSRQVSVDFNRSKNDYRIVFDPTGGDDGDAVQTRNTNGEYSQVCGLYSATIRPNDRLRLISTINADWYRKGIFMTPFYALPQHAFTEHQGISGIQRVEVETSQKTSLDIEIKGQASRNRFKDPDGWVDPEKSDVTSLQPLAVASARLKYQVAKNVTIAPALNISYEQYSQEENNNRPVSERPTSSRTSLAGGLNADVNITARTRASVMYLHRYDIDTSYGIPANFPAGTTLPPVRSATHHPTANALLVFAPRRELSFSVSGLVVSRNPDFMEKFGSDGDFRGNPNLRPELKEEVEVGGQAEFGFAKTSLTVYGGKTRDKIAVISRASSTFLPVNFSDVRHLGAEFDVDLQPWRWLSLTNRFSWTYSALFGTKDADLNGNLEPLVPPLEENFGCSFLLGPLVLEHRLHAVSAYFKSEENEGAIRHKPELDASIQWKLTPRSDIIYRVENYLDVQNFDFFRHYQPGRTHYLYLSASFLSTKGVSAHPSIPEENL